MSRKTHAKVGLSADEALASLERGLVGSGLLALGYAISGQVPGSWRLPGTQVPVVIHHGALLRLAFSWSARKPGSGHILKHESRPGCCRDMLYWTKPDVSFLIRFSLYFLGLRNGCIRVGRRILREFCRSCAAWPIRRLEPRRRTCRCGNWAEVQ